jgi:dTMP kinase
MQLTLERHRLPGRLIAVCGSDGTGKSTATRLLAERLRADGDLADVVHLRQPSDWMRNDPQYLRTIVQEGDGEIADELAIGVFGVADRLNQQARAIAPALAAGRTVVTDRYVHCLIAYYLSVREPQLDYLASICRPLFQPDLTFILDCPADIALDRIVRRDGSRPEKYEQQLGPTAAMLEAYRTLAQTNDVKVLSAVEPTDAVVARLVQECAAARDGA